MQTVGASLPEFNPCRGNGISAPIIRSLHFFSNPSGSFSDEGSYQLHSACYRLTLWRNSCANPAFIRTFPEVFIRFFRRNFRRYSLYMYLSFEGVPHKREGDIRILCQLPAFTAFIMNLLLLRPLNQVGQCFVSKDLLMHQRKIFFAPADLRCM